MSFDVNAVRARFPALRQTYGKAPAVFFDNPGGTQVPEGVIEAISDYLRRHNSNTHGVFPTSRQTDRVIREAHQAVADLLGAEPEEIVFGPNMTTLTFHLSRSLAKEFGPSDEIIVTHLDHDANIAPWLYLAEETGAKVRWLDIHPEDCTLDLEQLQGMLGNRTRLVAVGYASNATGTVNDVTTICRWAREVGAYTFIDAVQYAPHGLIDVKALGCDFLACSAYKFFGPHTGHLYGRREHLERLRPYKVRPASDEIPDRWETGTQNHEGMAGVRAAVDYLASLGSEGPGSRRRLEEAWKAIRRHEEALLDRLIPGLQAIPGVQVYGITDPSRWAWRIPTVVVRKTGTSPRQLAEELASQNIFCWDGNFYALAVSRRLGVEAEGGFLRVGLVHYNTEEEVEALLQALESL